MKLINTNTPRVVRGFTLIELMITIVIAAILVSIAIPSFTSLIRRNQITTYANEFATTVNLARNESIKRGQNITLSSNNGTDWTQGWNLNVNATGELLRVSAPLSGDNTFTSGANAAITFDSQGFTTLAPGTEENWAVCNANEAVGRKIRITSFGRISIREITPCL